MKVPEIPDIGLIADIHFVWSQIENIEVDSKEAFSEITESMEKVAIAFDELGVVRNSNTEGLINFGVLKAIQLIAWITSLRQQGLTLKKFIKDQRNIISKYPSLPYIKRYVIEENVDIFFP